MAEADRKPRIDGGAAVARTLAAAKVKTIFALHGGHLDAAFKGFLDEGIELVDTRHEACAGHAAEGWARLTGGLGVCMITAGPGFTNALTSMANARLDGVPVLFLAGAPPLREESLNVLQGGVDQIAMAAPVVKLAIRITDPDRIPDQLANAITVALGGRPGPVFVELPIDVMARPRACRWPCRCRCRRADRAAARACRSGAAPAGRGETPRGHSGLAGALSGDSGAGRGFLRPAGHSGGAVQPRHGPARPRQSGLCP
jgi:thiamine pyrophosphate-dependent acetolactate synthase large subunit-like protein